MIHHMQTTYAKHARISGSTAISVFAVLLFACGPGGPNDPVQPTAATQLVSVKDSAADFQSTHNPRPAENPAVPEWMAQALASSDVQVRLNALEAWAHGGGRGTVDPLMAAMNDPDERVRDRALQLIEQDWIAEQTLLSKKGGIADHSD